MEENLSQSQKQNYISLFEATKLCSHSEPYLRLRARQGKLKSIKLGKKWMTTAAWIADYPSRCRSCPPLVASPSIPLSPLGQSLRDVEPMVQMGPAQKGGCNIGTGTLGQIFPIPVQKPIKEVLNYGWFGAILSGAICALMLFFIVRPAAEVAPDVVVAVPLPTLSLPSGSKELRDAEPMAQGDMLQEQATSEAGRSDLLEKLVARLAQFFNNF